MRSQCPDFDELTAAFPALLVAVTAEVSRTSTATEHASPNPPCWNGSRYFRIGTEGYAEENQTYGLATMLKSGRKSYVDPRLVDCYLRGDTIAAQLDQLG